MKFRLKMPSLRVWAFIAAAIAGIGLLCFRLQKLVPHLILYVEQPIGTARQYIGLGYHEPLLLPGTLSRLAVSSVAPYQNVITSRLPSVVLGLTTLGMMYWLLRRWYGYRLAAFGTVLLASSAWFLHASRLATYDIVYPFSMMLALVLVSLWHQKNWSLKNRYFTAVASALLLYVPGFIFLLSGMALIERKNMKSNLLSSKKHFALSLILFLVLIAPLVNYIVMDWHHYALVLGYVGLFGGVLSYIETFFRTWQYIFIGGYSDPVRNVPSIPILDMFTSLAFVVGIYLYSRHPKAARTQQLLWLWLAGTALIALPSNIPLSLILPIVVVLATGGIGYLLHLWLRVFPRNPVARMFGITLIGIVLAFAVAYSLRSYYLAWPHNQQTKAVFQRQL